jgi:FeS assembly SUF system protein
MDKLELEQKIVEMIKTVYDPEIPVNIYDLGLIYRIEVKEDMSVDIDMTLTAPNCPAADFMLEDVKQKVESINGIGAVNLQLVFEPEWSQDLMTEEAKLELGFL